MIEQFNRSQVSAAIVRARRYADIASSQSILAYLQNVIIDCRPEPKLFRLVADPWQWTLLSRLTPAIEAISGVRKNYVGPSSFWLTLPRGSDKSSSIGRLLNWSLAYAKHPLRASAAAADRDQAGFIWEFMQAEARLNPWLLEHLEFKNFKAIGRDNGSRLKILTADAGSSFGLREDLLVLDEVTHWAKRSLWDTIVSGREKVPGSVLVIITNAGHLRTWQHEMMQAAKKSPDWMVYEAPGPLSSWISKEKIEETRRLLPKGVARRVLDNVWVDEKAENGFVTKDEVAACVDHQLSMQRTGSPQYSYFAAVDYGPVRDRTVLSVGHCEPDNDNRVVLDQMIILQGKDYPSGRVSIEAIERWIDEVRVNFPDLTLVLDLYQMESTAQRFTGTVKVVRYEPRGGKSNYVMASNLRSLIVNRRLVLYPNAGELLVPDRGFETLEDELNEVIVVQKSYGWRIDHESSGHDDRVCALGMMAQHASAANQLIEISSDSRWF